MSSALEGLTPLDFSLPPQFSSWRDIQMEGIEHVVYSDRRFNTLAMPTGSGKTLTVVSIARITGWRTVILTGTKGLQDQYTREFGTDLRAQAVLRKLSAFKPSPNELVDIRGKSNYHCTDYAQTDCENGPRMGCRCNGTLRCGYTNALTIARNSQTVITNYKYWFNINRGASAGLSRAIKPNPVEHLVLDEAHLAPEELAGFLAIRLYEKEIRELLHTPALQTDRLDEWRAFAREWHKTAELEAKERAKITEKKGARAKRADVEAVKRYEILADKLQRIKGIKPDGWVCESQEGGRMGRRWEFDPVWPGMYAEMSLFLGIPHITLVSGTVRPKTQALLGIKSTEASFKEWPRVFPGNRCPVYHIPTVRMRGEFSKAKREDLNKWVDNIDRIIDSRLERKGIIHTVSYERQKYLFENSRFSSCFLGNTDDKDSPNAARIVHDFKTADAPCILVSPSFSTGWDFPGEECEWQIITKVPFPSSRSKVMKERLKRDNQYLSYLAMQELVQAAGRGMRSVEDRCETFIVDDTIKWFLWTYRSLAPKWFEVRNMADIPKLPKALYSEIRKAIVRRVVHRITSTITR
jgi:ATP-dependent DNA helicase DinG